VKELNKNEQGKGLMQSFRMIFALSFMFVGLYFEIFSAVISVALIIWLYCQNKHRPLVFRWNAASVVAFVIFGLYTISPLWAVDKGLSTWAIAKYLPIPLFVICIMQLSTEDKLVLYRDIPYIGVIMTVLSFALQYIPVIGDFFSVNSRLAGFFQYPNTFACFLMLGILVLVFTFDGDGSKLRKVILLGILSVGIMLSGSRAVLLLSAVAIIIALIITKKQLVITAISVIAGLGIGYGLLLLSKSSTVGHVQELTTGASTYIGRLLYWKDALPQIFRNPFGLGHLGYYYSQSGFQTGVYSVRAVHNDFLQLMLDIGWIPAVLALIAIIKSVVSKNVSAMEKVFLLALLAHCFFDFNLSFIAMYFLIFLALDTDSGKTKLFRFSGIFVAFSAVFCAFSLYIGVASTFSYFNKDDIAVKLFPWDTSANIALLTSATDSTELEEISDRILSTNKKIAIAWDAKANIALTKGDFRSFINYKKESIALSRYAIEEYIEYFERLRYGREVYMKSGDSYSVSFCEEEILNIKTTIDEVLASTDELAWKIDQTPELELPDSYYDYIATF